MASQDEPKKWFRSNCPLFWSFLNKKAQTNIPKGLIEYISSGTPSEIETGRDNLTIIEKYLTDLKNLCGLKTVGDTYRRDLSGVDSANRLAELSCEIALCASLGNLSGKLTLRPSTGKGTYSDCLFNPHGFDIFAEAKRYVDPWPYIEKLGDGVKEDVPCSRSITQRPSGEKPNDSARPRSMDLRSKLRDVHRQFPEESLNILFLFHYSPAGGLIYPKRYITQALLGDSNFSKNEREFVLESDGLFYVEEWRNISACYLSRLNPGSGVIFPFVWKNPRAQLEIPKSVLEALS
jgi:hypothetical protein